MSKNQWQFLVGSFVPKKLQLVEMFPFHMTIHCTIVAYRETIKIDVLISKSSTFFMCLVYICQHLSSHPKILLCTELIKLWSNSPHINCDVIDISEGFKQLTFVLHCGLVNLELYFIHLHLPQHWILRFSRDSNYKPRSIHLSCWAKGGKESIILFHKWDSNFGLQAQKSETLPLIHHRVTRPSYWTKSFFIIDSK